MALAAALAEGGDDRARGAEQQRVGAGAVAIGDDPDPPPAEIPVLSAATLMDGAPARARLARIVLDYAAGLPAPR